MNLPQTLEASHQRIIALERELTFVKEQMQLMLKKLWGKSSEKRSPEASPQQALLFPTEATPSAPEKKRQVTYERREPLQGKVPEGARFPEHLERETTVIDEAEGKEALEKVTERLAARRGAFFVKRTVRKVRKVDGTLVTPELPAPVLKGERSREPIRLPSKGSQSTSCYFGICPSSSPY